MGKIKPVLPSLREKKRYLAFKVISKDKINNISAIFEAISRSISTFVGFLGFAKAGIIILPNKYDKEKQIGLIKVNHNYVNELKASLAMIREIDGKKVVVRSIGVSGILNKAEKKYIVS